MTSSSSMHSSNSSPDSDNNVEKGVENNDSQAFSAAPDGGVRAWLVVAGGFLTYFATFGLLNTFGIYQVYYEQHMLQGKSSSVISWIGSIQLFILFFGGLVFGPIFDTHGSKILLIPGTIIYVLSIMLTSLCTRYYEFILAQGVLFGIGDAMLFYPTISAISHWFDKKRGFALGIVVAGSSLGGVAWPLILPKLFDEVGFAWATRIVGFMCLVMLIPCCFFIIPRLPPRKADVGNDDFKAMFHDKGYLIFVGGMFFVLWGLFIPFYYIPLYGLSHKMSNYMANNLVVTLNAGSLVGRVVSGFIADKLGRFNITFVSALIAGILILCLHAIDSGAGIIAFSVLYGFFSGGLISLQSACVAQITEKKDMIGVRIGFMMAVCALGALTGNPIGGALISSSGGGFGGFIDFSGIILLVGAFLALYARYVLQPRWSKAF